MRRRGGGTGESTQEEGADCNVRRELKSLWKQINEIGIFQIGFGRWSREGDRKHFHGFCFELVFYNSRLVVGGNNNSFVEKKKKGNLVWSTQTETLHNAEIVGCSLTQLYVEV